MEHFLYKEAKKMLKKADSGTDECKKYNSAFLDGLSFAIKELTKPSILKRDCGCAIGHNKNGRIEVCDKCAKSISIIA